MKDFFYFLVFVATLLYSINLNAMHVSKNSARSEQAYAVLQHLENKIKNLPKRARFSGNEMLRLIEYAKNNGVLSEDIRFVSESINEKDCEVIFGSSCAGETLNGYLNKTKSSLAVHAGKIRGAGQGYFISIDVLLPNPSRFFGEIVDKIRICLHHFTDSDLIKLTVEINEFERFNKDMVVMLDRVYELNEGSEQIEAWKEMKFTYEQSGVHIWCAPGEEFFIRLW